MKSRRSKSGGVTRRRTTIRTSIMELMQELANLTNDDNQVVGAMKSIFGAYRVRLASAPVRVRLEGGAGAPRVFAKKSGRGISLRFV